MLTNYKGVKNFTGGFIFAKKNLNTIENINMYKHLIKRYWMLFSLVWLLITGCTQFSLNLEDRIKQVNNGCQMNVVDSRPDESVFIDGLTVKPIPSVREVLYSKLCRNDEIQEIVRAGIELKVYISGVQCDIIKRRPRMYFPYLYKETGLIGGITGSIHVKKPGEEGSHEYLIMPPLIKMEKYTYSKKETYKEFIVAIIEDFASEIEKMITKIQKT